MSQVDLGNLLGYHHSLISRIESGDRWPPPGLADRCDVLLNTGGEFARLWPLVEDERRMSCGRRRAAQRDPREAAWQPALPGPPDPPFRTPEEVVGGLRSLFAAYERVMEDVGVSLVGAVVEGHVRTILACLKDASPHMASVLLPTAARYGWLAGWACFEQGDYRRATAWLERALTWAVAGGDRSYAGFLHTRIGVVARARGDNAQSLARGQAGLEASGGRPWVAAFAAMVQARAYGALGRQRECERQLERAQQCADRSDPADAPWWLLPSEGNLVLSSARAACYRDLAVRTGRIASVAQAVEHARTALDQVPPGRLPYRMLNAVRLADAYACAGQPDAAVAAVEPVFAVPSSLWYSPVRSELRALGHRLVRGWPDLPEVSRLTGRLRSPERLAV